MDNDLWNVLSGATGVTELCGERIHWDLAPQGVTRPYLVLTIVSGADEPHLTGTDGLWDYRVQVDCYGANRPSARALSHAVVATLNGHSDDHLRGVFCIATRANTDASGAQKSARISHDFTVKWRA